MRQCTILQIPSPAMHIDLNQIIEPQALGKSHYRLATPMLPSQW